ncbi:TRAFAC class myosin-kinesin ATPase superfamily [Bonamia ostreae]|uniref:TRAFAC class myosin-kinesin ATPase superfamily n=1 Tax=Bonamia ostreae TaxID=126728 RepID=A0ABV2AMP6_9EUKA
MPKGTPDILVSNVFSGHGRNKKLKRVKMNKELRKSLLPKEKFNGFLVVHFAEDVVYNCNEFLLKNKDLISDETSAMFASSKSELLSSIFEAGAKRRKGVRKNVGKTFVGSLEKLVATLNDSTQHFIRCMNPNTEKVFSVTEVEPSLGKTPRRAATPLRGHHPGAEGGEEGLSDEDLVRGSGAQLQETCLAPDSGRAEKKRVLESRSRRVRLQLDQLRIRVDQNLLQAGSPLRADDQGAEGESDQRTSAENQIVLRRAAIQQAAGARHGSCSREADDNGTRFEEGRGGSLYPQLGVFPSHRDVPREDPRRTRGEGKSGTREAREGAIGSYRETRERREGKSCFGRRRAQKTRGGNATRRNPPRKRGKRASRTGTCSERRGS